MGTMSVFENMVEKKLLNVHTAFIAKVLSTDGKKAKIQPLGMSQAYGEDSLNQSVLSNIPIIHSARWKLEEKRLWELNEIVEQNVIKKGDAKVLVVEKIEAGDLVVCVCGERDITKSKKGINSIPVYGHHSMSDAVIVGIL